MLVHDRVLICNTMELQEAIVKSPFRDDQRTVAVQTTEPDMEMDFSGSGLPTLHYSPMFGERPEEIEVTDVSAEAVPPAAAPAIQHLLLAPGVYEGGCLCPRETFKFYGPVDILADGAVTLNFNVDLPEFGRTCTLHGLTIVGSVYNRDKHSLIDCTVLDQQIVAEEEEESDIDFDLFW